ncbi:MAG TPA: prolipoprotein diacylglyceryl transferase family protein [Allosphingosinicella sp.]|nr:prolipoprotein diacylglyceryl transferase family protein [Allosphingosinicella sp.]
MISVPTAPWAHYLGDAAAWLAAALAARWQHRRWPEDAPLLAQRTRPGYFLSLALGAVLGAWLFGSINSLRALAAAPSHSVAGALAGGILSVELWKWRHGVRQSTGTVFVLPLCIGIVLGRLGCLFSGLADYTYGVPTDLPWATDLGDGIGRHPVQIYEAATMAGFLFLYLRARLRGRLWARDHAFHAMIMVYAAQRFWWEFLKPYPLLLGPLNLFHILMGGLFAYALIWWRRGHALEAGAAARAA